MSDNQTKASNDPLDASASPEERLLFAIFKNDPDKCINALKACWCNRAAEAAEADMKKMEAEEAETEKAKAKAEKPEPEETKDNTSDDDKADKVAQEAQTALEQFFDELIRDVVDKALDDDESEDSKDKSDESKDSDDSDDSKASEESENSDSNDDDDFDEEDRDFSNEDILEDNGVIDDFDVKTGVRHMNIPRDIYDVIKKRYDDGERVFFKLLAGTNAPIDVVLQFKDVHVPKCEYYVPIYADTTYYMRVKTYSRTAAYIYATKKFNVIKNFVKAYKDYDGSTEPHMGDDTDTVLSKRGYERSKRYFESILLPVRMTVNEPPKVLDADMD